MDGRRGSDEADEDRDDDAPTAPALVAGCNSPLAVSTATSGGGGVGVDATVGVALVAVAGGGVGSMPAPRCAAALAAAMASGPVNERAAMPVGPGASLVPRGVTHSPLPDSSARRCRSSLLMPPIVKFGKRRCSALRSGGASPSTA